MGEGIFVLEGQRTTAPGERGGVAHKQEAVYKGKKGKPCFRMSLFRLGVLIRAAERRLLIAKLQYFYSSTSVVSLLRRKWPNKEAALGM